MDLTILAALMSRRRWTSLHHAVPKDTLTPETGAMMAWFSLYYTTFPEREHIDVDELLSLIRLRSTGSSAEQVAVAVALANKLRTPVPADVIQGIASSLYERDFAGRAGSLINQYNDGGEVDLAYEVGMLAQAARRAIVDGATPNWASGDILDYLAQESDEGGLQWTTFPILNATLKGLQRGDNVAISAPTDKGKTSLLCRLAVDFQEQAKVLYPDQPLLYLVNEGTQERITTRMYQTVCGKSRHDMQAMAESGELQRLFNERMGGRDMIRVANIHGKSVAQVSRIIEQHSPHTVITDMTGRIRAMSNKSGGGNDIAQLEEVWNDMRELAVLQDFAHIGTTQVSAEGFDMFHPPLSAMQNSKTGIQTTLDLVLMMGAKLDQQFINIRGISTPKNKLARSGQQSLQKFEVNFNPQENTWG